MDVTRQNSSQDWPDVFRQLVVTNCGYWLDRAMDDVECILPEVPQVLQGLNYGLSITEAWGLCRDLILHLSPVMIRQGQGATWENFLKKAIASTPSETDPGEIEFHLQLGELYRLQGRLTEAQTCFQTAIHLCEQYGDRTHYWTLTNQLGLIARLMARHDDAVAYSQQVLKGLETTIVERAEALNVLGLVAYDHRQWDEALAYLEQALGLYRSLNDAYQMARILTNQGVVLQRCGRLDEAELTNREAIQQFQVCGDQAEIFKTVMNLGNILLMRHAYESAIEQYQQAVPHFRRCHYSIDLANVYNNLGMAYGGLSQWETAEAYFKASLDIAGNLDDGCYQANILDNFAKMLLESEQTERAGEVLNQALDILSSVAYSPARARLQQVVQDRLHHLEDDV